jgi:uncharacterized protein with von Willebrand factor type A (vWA) domain
MVTGTLTADLATVAAAFGARLRDAGIPATPERAARFAAAVGLGRPATVPAIYWLARVTLVDRPDQFDAFDRVFAAVFGGVADVAERRGDPSAPALPPHSWPGPRVRAVPEASSAETGVLTPGAEAGSSRDAAAQPTAQLTASIEERLGHKDFAAYTPEELAVLRRLVAELRIVAPRRRARRTARAVSGRRLDVRRTLRRAHRTGGDPVRREFRRRRQRPRPVVLIADVSGSMDPYARVYLQLLQGAVRGARAEAFVMATRLTRLTRALAAGHPDDALARAAAAAQDWSGGTRIGESLKAFLDGYGRRGMARGAVVVIVSDGWERADPAVLGEQMERLARLAHRVVWVNPRSADERYQPLVGGMAAALPHVDVLLSGHSLRALDDVLAAIGECEAR